MNSTKYIALQSKNILFFILACMLLTGCATQAPHPLFIPSQAMPIQEYVSFEEYVTQTEQMLRANRHFLTIDKEREIQANLPSEIKPKSSSAVSRGVLLVHGLGDSPYSFVDIAKALADKGFLVRTVLLSGHGTRPADLIHANYKDWQNLVAKQVALLKKDVEEVYLGGFSTGANLVYSYAVQDYDIQGLMLFSPAFQSNEPLLFMAPLIASFDDWLGESSPDNITNYARYNTVPINGFAQYYRTSKQALHFLEKEFFTRPVFMVLSEHDSVLNIQRIKELFDNRFINGQSRLVWYGHTRSRVNNKTRYINSHVPELRISNMSHMGILFAPDNPFYGINGSERICQNAPDALQAQIEACRKGEPVWYSSWIEDKKHLKSPNFHARLTFNPKFHVMMDDLFNTFSIN